MLLFSNRMAAMTATFVGLFFFMTKTTTVLSIQTTTSMKTITNTKGSVTYTKELEKGFHKAFVTSHLFPKKQKKQQHRKLEDGTPKRVCNELLEKTSKQAVLLYLRVIYGSFLPSAVYSRILDAFELNVVKYDVAVFKVCGRCQDFCNGDNDSATCRGFCETSAYGYDAQHSALAFLPLQPSNNSMEDLLLLEGQLRTVFSFHGFTPDAYQGPTDYYPDFFTAELLTVVSKQDDTAAISVFLADNLPIMNALISASAGAVGIVPDFLGYGESLTTHNRTFVFPSTYQQAAMVSYQSTQALLQEKSNCTTALQHVIEITGYSEGGFAATSAAAAMTQAGFRVLTNRLGAPLLDAEESVAFLFKSYNENLISPTKFNRLMPLQTAVSGYAGSIEVPGIPNTGFPNQTFLSSVWMDPSNFSRNVIDWLAAPDPLTTGEIFPLLPSPNFLELLNPVLLKLLETTGDSDWCREENTEVGVNDKICEAIRGASVYDVLAALSSSSSSPPGTNTTSTASNVVTTICSSTGDTIIPETMFPPEIFNDFVLPIQTIFGTALTEDHGLTSFLCEVVYLNSLIGLDNDGLPSNIMHPDDIPDVIDVLGVSDLERCLAKTRAPTSAPVTTCAEKNKECSEISDCCKGGKKLKCDNNVCTKCAKSKKKCKENADCCSNKCKKKPAMGKKRKTSFICK